MVQETLQKGDMYTNVLNDVLRTSTGRWINDEKNSGDIEIDSLILNTVSGIARQSGYELSIEFDDRAKTTNQLGDLIGWNCVYLLNGKIKILAPPNREKHFSLKFGEEGIVFKRGRKEAKLKREDILSVKAQEKK